MENGQYIRIYKKVKSYVKYFYQVKTIWNVYEFYFTGIAHCARWLGVSYNAVKFCLRGDYKFCEGYTIGFTDEKPDERRIYVDPDRYRNPDVRKALGLPEEGIGMYYPDR